MYLVKAIISDRDRAEKIGNTILTHDISKEISIGEIDKEQLAYNFGINKHKCLYKVEGLSNADSNKFYHLRRFYPEVQVLEVRQ